jgi:hypothetical protein
MPDNIMVKTPDGLLHFDTKDAIGAWTVEFGKSTSQTLFRLPNGYWVFFGTFPRDIPLWTKEGRLVDESEAIDWLLQYNLDIPEDLTDIVNRKHLARRMQIGIPKLNYRQYDILEALRVMGATNAEERRTTQKIAEEAQGKSADPKQFKIPIAALVQLGFVGSQEGRAGGIWLTDVGLQVAQRCADERAINRKL